MQRHHTLGPARERVAPRHRRSARTHACSRATRAPTAAARSDHCFHHPGASTAPVPLAVQELGLDGALPQAVAARRLLVAPAPVLAMVPAAAHTRAERKATVAELFPAWAAQTESRRAFRS